MRAIKILPAALLLLLPVFCSAQARSAAKTQPVDAQIVRSSPAYSEVLLRKTELEADIEALLTDYTEDFPKIQEDRYALTAIDAEMKKLQAVKPGEASKLTLALGKLMVRKVEVETDLWRLQKQYKDDHPEVKRAKKKAEIFEKAINEILG
ncbi:MAG TPA: hypothetical protein VL325_09765 [Pyrinomonadaceae bacterium]|jgi:uncharacterized protein involved in exopolysaccharide biosynthesis|nr:hypothetical protein [Pyrinomonadaceae bacterium]